MNPIRLLDRSLRRRLLLILCLVALLPLSASRAADKGPFDGTWDTTVSCSNTQGAQGYSYRFSSVVKDGQLHGERGTKGQPGWLQLEGKITSDGVGKFYANGLVGALRLLWAPSGGHGVGYHVDAKFSGDSGTGKRVEGRPCELTSPRRSRERPAGFRLASA